jgi:2-succinyl-5-enolpyruvyl-6-hydroxy-3-cyclohexene-1-carboxylate synthase
LTPDLPSNISIVIFNNGGGGIFKILDGPSEMPELNPYVFTPHTFDLSHIAKMHSLNFQSADNMNEVQEAFTDLKQSKACSILEIITDAAINSQQFKQYKSNKI